MGWTESLGPAGPLADMFDTGLHDEEEVVGFPHYFTLTLFGLLGRVRLKAHARVVVVLQPNTPHPLTL